MLACHPAGRSTSRLVTIPQAYEAVKVNEVVDPGKTTNGFKQAVPPGVQVEVGVGVLVTETEGVAVIVTDEVAVHDTVAVPESVAVAVSVPERVDVPEDVRV